MLCPVGLLAVKLPNTLPTAIHVTLDKNKVKKPHWLDTATFIL